MKNVVHIWEISQRERFSVILSTKFLDDLRKKIEADVKTKTNLTKLVRNRISRLKEKTFENVRRTFITSPLLGERPFPLDCLIETCKILSIPLLSIEKEIKGIKVPRGKNLLRCNFPIIIDEDWAVVSESIRTEGSISLSEAQFYFTNSDLSFIKLFCDSLRAIGVEEDHIHKYVYVHIQIPPETKKEDVIVVDEESGQKLDKFWVLTQNNPKGKKRVIVLLLPFISNFFNFIIKTNSQEIHANINISNDEITIKSSYRNSVFKNTGYSVYVRVYNAALTKLLISLFEIPAGKKSSRTRVPNIIKSSPQGVIKKAFEITFASEGGVTFDPKTHTKHLAITSKSKEFLEDWKDLLVRFGIYSAISKSGNKFNLLIYRQRDLGKCLRFNFIKSEGKNKLRKMLNSYKFEAFPRSMIDECYLDAMKELGGETDLYRLAKKVKRSLPAVIIRLNKMIKKEQINRKVGKAICGNVRTRSIYSITPKGYAILRKMKNNLNTFRVNLR